MDHPTLQQGPSSCCAASPLDGHSLDIFDELGRVTVSLCEEEHPVLLPSYRRVVGAAKAASRFNERLQHRLEIESRAADHLEHIGGGGLLVQRPAQLARARLHLVEQPHVLDRDHRLIGERGHQLDLLVGKWAHRASHQHDHANRLAFTQQRNTEHRTVVADLRWLYKLVFRIGENVGYLNDSAFKRGSAGDSSSTQLDWIVPHILHKSLSENIRRDYKVFGA